MGARGARIRRDTQHHPPDHEADLEADRLQRGFQQAVLLEAVAAAPIGDEFPLKRGQIQFDPPTEHDVEVFEGNGAGVGG